MWGEGLGTRGGVGLVTGYIFPFISRVEGLARCQPVYVLLSHRRGKDDIGVRMTGLGGCRSLRAVGEGDKGFGCRAVQGMSDVWLADGISAFLYVPCPLGSLPPPSPFFRIFATGMATLGCAFIRSRGPACLPANPLALFLDRRAESSSVRAGFLFVFYVMRVGHT